VPSSRTRSRIVWTLLSVAGASSCSTGSEPELDARLAFSTSTLDLGALRAGDVELRNGGGRAVGPVLLLGGEVRDPSGVTVPGSRIVAEPSEIPTLNAGDVRLVHVSVALQGTLTPGDYDAVLLAHVAGQELGRLVVRFQVDAASVPAGSIRILAPGGAVRRGDVVPLPVEVLDADGHPLDGAAVSWTVEPTWGGLVGSGGSQFVGYEVGSARLIATAGIVSDTLDLEIGERGGSGTFAVVGRGLESAHFTSDLWLHGSVAYTGTWSGRPGPNGTQFGNTLNVWDITELGGTTLVGDVRVDARTVNDVKVRGDGRLAVITHEGSSDGQNGVTLLDLADPRHPVVVSRFTDELQSGVHNAWLDGSWLYLVVDGTGNGLRVLDVADPAHPRVVARYWAGESFLHDVYVRDGLAFLSHWNAGLVILDVGNGVSGGTPTAPVEVSRLANLAGQTHNAWYWPQAGYVFVGEEDMQTPGRMHVVDVRNLSAPREVATFSVPGQTPHNFWLDEEKAVLYLAWYGNGIRALDVSGDLLGELQRQGREIAWLRYDGGSGSCALGDTTTCTWAPQLHQGLVWVSDMNQGLVALEPPR